MRPKQLFSFAFGLVFGGGLCPHSALWATQPGSYKADFEDLEWVLVQDSRASRVRLHLERDRQPLANIWPESIRGLFALAAGGPIDTDGVEPTANAARTERLPSAWALMQKTSGIFANGPGSGPPFKELDRKGAQTIESPALIEYYRRAGLGEALIGAGKAAVEKPLGEALASALDGDGDGKITQSELAAAEKLLAKLDANGDELITPGELLPRTAYPGAAGTHWLRAPKAEGTESSWNRGFALLVLPSSRADLGWSQALIARLDRNADRQLDAQEIVLKPAVFARLDQDQSGKLSAEEVSSWRDLDADADWTMELGKVAAVASVKRVDPKTANQMSPTRLPIQDRLDASLPGVQIALRVDAGTLPSLWQEFRGRMLSKFRELDSKGSGFVAAAHEKAAPMSEWDCVLYCADANLDGKVSEAELTGWLTANEAYSRSVAMITMLDHGTGLFALLDADHDGALSLRELRLAAGRLAQSGAMEKGVLLLDRLPGQFRVTVALGPSRRLLFPRAQKGPAWFQAMDRNGDGDLSRKECPFPAAWFERHDKDRDGLIDFQEALAIPMTEKAGTAVP